MGKLESDLLASSQVLEGRWTVRAKLGGGGFGQVYRAFDSKANKEVAIKVEPRGKKEVLLVESAVFGDLTGKPHAPTFYGYGSNSNINYLVMDVLGKNLSDLRRDSPGPRTSFSKRTTFLLSLQGLEAIADMHKAGHLHRDVKPANYVMGFPGTPQARVVFLIDFGLARPLFDKNHNLRKARPPGGFRGTVKYASIAAHDGVDLGRKDDIKSLFYMILEMGKGSLPWRKLREKTDVGRAKKAMPLPEACEELSPKLARIGQELEKYGYETEPDYDLFLKLLTEMLTEAGGSRATVLDWDDNWATLLQEQGNQPARALARTTSANMTTGAATGTITPDDVPHHPNRTTARTTGSKSPRQRPKGKGRASVTQPRHSFLNLFTPSKKPTDDKRGTKPAREKDDKSAKAGKSDKLKRQASEPA